MGRNVFATNSVDGDQEQVKAYNMASGIMGSYMEGHIFAQTFAEEIAEEGAEPVSTMHILQHANREGIPVYTIDKENVDEVLPELQYSSDEKKMFRNFVKNGKEITVPERKVTLGGWNGTGYIVMNEDGTGVYMISGGLAGGFLDDIKDIVLYIISVTRDGIPRVGASVLSFALDFHETWNRIPNPRCRFDSAIFGLDLLVIAFGLASALTAVAALIPVIGFASSLVAMSILFSTLALIFSLIRKGVMGLSDYNYSYMKFKKYKQKNKNIVIV